MVNCEECKKEFNNLNGLSKHIKIHMTSKKYFDKYVKKDNDSICKECGETTRFDSLAIGYLKYCGNTCPSNKELGKEFKESIQRKYGVDNISKLDSVKRKKVKTFKRNYGVDNIFETQEFKDNLIENNLKKYGVKYLSQTESVKIKRKETFKEKYGGHPMVFNNEVKEKCHYSYQKQYLKKLKLYQNRFQVKLLSEYISGIEGKKVKLIFQCIICNSKFNSTWGNVFQGCGRCTKCFPKHQGFSIQEKEIFEFIKFICNDEILQNSRDIIPPKELDIYIPSKNIAIEFNGLYWHSEEVMGDNAKKYHLDKTIECEKQGIQLIHIFEDEWIFKKDIVKSKLRNILKVRSKNIIDIRECLIQEVDVKIKSEFLEKNHIEGKAKSDVNIGSFYRGELIYLMIFSKDFQYQTWELNRFCSKLNYQISGMALKLLSHFKKNYGWDEIFSYADRRWSQGDVWKKLGFELSCQTFPEYFYVDRVNRYREDLSKWFLRTNKRYSKIWDCGNLKFNFQL